MSNVEARELWGMPPVRMVEFRGEEGDLDARPVFKAISKWLKANPGALFESVDFSYQEDLEQYKAYVYYTIG